MLATSAAAVPVGAVGCAAPGVVGAGCRTRDGSADGVGGAGAGGPWYSVTEGSPVSWPRVGAAGEATVAVAAGPAVG
ncbi:MAG TPA: hypothetical protein VJB36_04300, partial [Methylomirabilota bacterium]|nr:hypothetical protein [Methylomirabilota bacterium]